MKRSDHFDLIGVVEPDRKKRSAAEKNPVYRDVNWLTEEALLATKDLKFVTVETRVEDLLATAARCVVAGVHIHLDKLAGESLQSLSQLFDAATSRGLCVQMGYMYRHNPAFSFCYDVVRNGWLGESFEVHGLMSKEISQEERKRNLHFRGGMMFQLGCHLIDAMVRMLGPAQGVQSHTRRLRPKLDNLADNQLAVFEYPQATATIRVSVTEFDGWKRRQFVVAGTEGTVEIRPLEPPQLTLTLKKPRGKFASGTHEVAWPAMTGRYDDQLIELARIARGQVKNEYTPDHDLAVQKLLLQASGMATDE
jgi:predicted dehydrogenase